MDVHSLKQKQILIANAAKKVGIVNEKFPHEERLQELIKQKEQYYAQKYEIGIKKIKEHFEQLGKTPEQIVYEYIERVNKLSFQGGYGHSFRYKIAVIPEYCAKSKYGWTPPHHWVVKPEHYEESKPSHCEQFALDYMAGIHGSDFHCSIKRTPASERWGN